MHAVAVTIPGGLLALFVPFAGAPTHEVEWQVAATNGVAPSPLTGAERRTWRVLETTNDALAFGWSLSSDADLDGDGTHDLIVGCPIRRSGGYLGHGASQAFQVWSGATGELRATTRDGLGGGARQEVVFAEFVHGLPAHGERAAAVLVGCWLEPGSEGPEGARVEVHFSGESKAKRVLRPDVNRWTGVGRAFGVVRDGERELVVLGASNFATERRDGGALLYFDLESGELVRHVAPAAHETGFGDAIATTEAWPQEPDGVLATCAFDEVSHEVRVRCFDARGALLAGGSFSVKLAGSCFEPSLACVGDRDGDGVADWALGSPTQRPMDVVASGVVLVTESSTGRVQGLHTDDGQGWFGANVLGVGDWNGDGVADLAVTTRAVARDVRGRVQVFDGKTLAELERFVDPLEAKPWEHPTAHLEPVDRIAALVEPRDFGRALAAWSAPATEGEGRVPRLAIGEAGRVWVVDAPDRLR